MRTADRPRPALGHLVHRQLQTMPAVTTRASSVAFAYLAPAVGPMQKSICSRIPTLRRFTIATLAIARAPAANSLKCGSGLARSRGRRPVRRRPVRVQRTTDRTSPVTATRALSMRDFTSRRIGPLGPVADLWWPLGDHHHPGDPARALPAIGVRPSVALLTPRSQMPGKFASQRPAHLEVQRADHRLVQSLHLIIVGV